METQRTAEALRTLLLGDDPDVMDEEAQTKVWATFSKAEQDAIRERYGISYRALVGLSGDDARYAGSLLEWARTLKGATETVRALVKLGLEIEEADTHTVRETDLHPVTLKGPVEQLEEAARADLAYREFNLDEE